MLYVNDILIKVKKIIKQKQWCYKAVGEEYLTGQGSQVRETLFPLQ